MSDEVKNCPSCGAVLVFDPVAGGLKCPSCGYAPETAEATSEEAGFEKDLTQLLGKEDLNEAPESITVNCPACGGETVLPENQVAGFCQFCKSPIVASSKAQKTIRPQGVLPFKITEEVAREAFKKWRDGLWFAPNVLKDSKIMKKMEGTYTPVWTFDFSTRTYYSGRRGEDYQVEETYEEEGKRKTRTVTKTRWYNVTGIVRDSFDDILVYARDKAARSLMNSLRPWEVKGSQDYAEDTIRGFVEESYDIPIRQGLTEAKEQAEPKIEDSIITDIGGDHQEISSKSITYSNLTYKLLLLPMWEAKYRCNGKDFAFVVNGQNGNTSGERPWSAAKLTAFIGTLIVIAGIILYFVAR